MKAGFGNPVVIKDVKYNMALHTHELQSLFHKKYENGICFIDLHTVNLGMNI